LVALNTIISKSETPCREIKNKFLLACTRNRRVLQKNSRKQRQTISFLVLGLFEIWGTVDLPFSPSEGTSEHKIESTNIPSVPVPSQGYEFKVQIHKEKGQHYMTKKLPFSCS